MKNPEFIFFFPPLELICLEKFFTKLVLGVSPKGAFVALSTDDAFKFGTPKFYSNSRTYRLATT